MSFALAPIPNLGPSAHPSITRLAAHTPAAAHSMSARTPHPRRPSRLPATKPETETPPPQVDRFNLSQTTPDIDQMLADSDGAGDEPDAATKKAAEVVKGLPVEQQQALSNLYLYLVQHPESNLGFAGWQSIQRAFSQYQVLIWRPAELLNGRMAMLGFVAGLGCEYFTGASIWQQQNFAPFSYLTAYLVIIAASGLNRQFGRPSKGVGPFTRKAELFNSRAAMVGYAILAYAEYNIDIRRQALLWASQLQHMQIPGVST